MIKASKDYRADRINAYDRQMFAIVLNPLFNFAVDSPHLQKFLNFSPLIFGF